MKADEIMELFRQFESIANDYEGVECWSARELSKLLGYTQWRNFENIVEKAKAACRPRRHIGMPVRMSHTILLTSAKWSPSDLAQKESFTI